MRNSNVERPEKERERPTAVAKGLLVVLDNLVEAIDATHVGAVLHNGRGCIKFVVNTLAGLVFSNPLAHNTLLCRRIRGQELEIV